MSTQELFGLLGAGLPLGLLLLTVLNGRDRQSVREKVSRWCLWFGGLSFLALGTTALLGFDLVPTKGVLGMAFIGLPALVAGLLLFLVDRFFPHGNKEGNNNA